MSVSKEAVIDRLKTISGPDFSGNIVDLGMVSEIFIADAKVFFSITVPLISPTLFFVTIVQTIAALQVFDQAFLLFYRDGTSSAPDAAMFYGVYIFLQAFRQFNFGLAAAMAWLLFVIILGITAIQITVGNRLVHYEGGNR